MIATFILIMYGIIFEMPFHFSILLLSNCLESNYEMTASKTQINKILGCALVTSQISVYVGTIVVGNREHMCYFMLVNVQGPRSKFGLRGPNGELPRARGAGWGNNNRKLTNLTLQFKMCFTCKLIQYRKTQHLARNYNTVVKTSCSSCFERTKNLSASIEVH